MKILTMMMVLGLAVGVATASTVEVWIQDRGYVEGASSNMYYVVASCEPTGNGGIAVVDVPITADYTSLINKIPLVASAPDGFELTRSANGVSPLNGSQNTIDASSTMFYGIGQEVVDITMTGESGYVGLPIAPAQCGQALPSTVGVHTLTKPAGASWNYGIALATGMYGSTLPSIDTNFSVSFYVFNNTTTPPGTAGGLTHKATTVIIPEPVTICLLVMGGLALVRRRR